jgi:hypothetical protein
MLKNDLSTSTLLRWTILINGTNSAIGQWDMQDTVLPSILKRITKMLNMSYPVMADGHTTHPMDAIFGFLTMLEFTGHLITMEDGYGRLFMAMCGPLMILGDTLLIIMEDGIGIPITIGIGSRDTTGHQLG